MKSFILGFCLIFVTSLARGEWTDLNPILGFHMKVNASGEILKPVSATEFRKTSNGWDSEFSSLKKINGKESSYFLNFPRGTQQGRGQLVEGNANGLISVTNCTKGIKVAECSTLSLAKCTQMFKNFANVENTAMNNPLIKSAFDESKSATDIKFIEKFKTNLRQCTEVFHMINNMEGGKNGFALDQEHAKVLRANIQSFSIDSSADVSYSNLQESMLSVVNKAEIFSKCGEIIQQDQMSKGRTTLLPASEPPPAAAK